MNITTLKWQQKYCVSNQWEKSYLIWMKYENRKSQQQDLNRGPVRIQKFCNAIPTRPLGTWKVVDVKYT